MTTARAEAPDRQHATASRVAEQATALFADKGFASTSIREIAEAAGVTKPTVYYYFGSKEGLIRHILDGAMGQLLGGLHRAAEGSETLQDQLVAFARAQLEFAGSHPATVVLIGRCHHEPPGQPWADSLRARQREAFVAVADLFRAAIARGEIAARDPMLLTLSLFGALITHTTAALHAAETSKDATDTARVASQLVELLLDGARPRPTDGGATENP